MNIEKPFPQRGKGFSIYQFCNLSSFLYYFFERYSWIAAAAFFPAPMAKMTVADPVTISPPRKQPHGLLAGFILCYDVTPLIRFQTGCSHRDDRIGVCSYGDNNRVYFNNKFGALLFDWPPATGLIRSPSSISTHLMPLTIHFRQYTQ